ncbi:two-component regulator propeller domain-containing protein [Shivajiella indica]|uniref:histidine kinase n=1 Tax=Shivajiella indica TaxID=872115 RepID=A0ABW5BCA3_9BACT
MNSTFCKFNLRLTLTIAYVVIVGIQAHPVFAQFGLSFRQLSVNDGLSQNSAVSVTQDQEGFLWIATQEGLNRYDGLEFVVYNRKFLDITEEKRLLLGKVYADSKNRIWIIPESSTPELLNRETNDFSPLQGITSANCIFEDEEKHVFFGTLSGQLFQWNESIQQAEMVLVEPEKEFVAINQYGPKNLLITFKNSLALFNTESRQLREIWQTEPQVFLSSAKTDLDGNIWIGTLNKGIWVLPSSSLQPISLSEYFNNQENQENMILDIMVDSKQRIWAATYGNGIALIQPESKEIQYFNYSKQNPRSLHYDDILCIFEDYTGTLWFGSDGAGLSFYDSYLEKFNFFHNQQVPEDIHIDVVRAIYVDEFEQVWLGTSGKGLTKYDPRTNSWKTFTHNPNESNSIASNRVMSLEGDGKGNLWIGYQDEGLSIFNIQSGKIQHFNQETFIKLPATTIWKILKDGQNRFWLGTRNSGLIQFSPNQGVIAHFFHDPDQPYSSIPDNNVRAIIESGSNEFWIGTENQGIAKLNLPTGKFQQIRHQPNNPKSLSSNNIKSLHLAEDNILWVGTNGAGLNRLDLNSMEVGIINTASGLSNDVIYGILPDNRGNLWLSSNKGITKVETLKNEDGSFPITNYSNYDGLATEFNTGAYFKTNDGTLYFGSLEGFYWFKAEDISLNETQPKTALTELMVFEQAIKISDNLKLKHNQNTLTINMASLVFSSPGKNEFQYKMEGYEDNWINSGNNHQARYTNLSPGNYTFYAKSSNYDGIWSEEPVGINFTILPPWYLEWWAYLIYAFFLAMVLIWVYQYLKWRWQMQYNLKMKDEEAQRLKEIDEFKTNLFTNISHEFRTPLTLIAGPVERLISQSENPIVKSQLNLVKQNSQRLLNLVDQLLEVTKIKSGKHQLRVKKGNLGLLIQSIVSNFFYLAAEKDMRIIPAVPLMTEVWFDSDKIEKILSNLLQNAIKYGKSGTDIEVSSYLKGNHLHLKVTNTSVQKYSPEEITHLFDKFYKPDLKSEGFGIGLPLIKDLVELNHGKIELNVNEGKKLFAVSIRLPIDKFSFRPEEVIEEEEKELQLTSLRSAPKNENTPLVLVIEDNEEVRTFISNELLPYYQVLEAADGKEGLYQAFKKIPDLIISDVMMPDIDGINLCETLKKDEKTSHVPIILLTAKSEEADKIKGLEVGADDYVLKPFSTKQLLLRIEKLIELRNNLRIRYSGKNQISPNEISLTSTDEKFLKKIQKIVDEDLSDSNFTIEEFCKKVGMSRMQLHRKLTAMTGLSTTAFIRDQRLRLAIQRLERSGESISEIAYSVGFSSPSYFIKCFKETYQMTPSEYLEREK